jgi:hypothetical protein
MKIRLNEEESDIECYSMNRENGLPIDTTTGDDYSWKFERVKILNYIYECVKNGKI